MNPEEKLARTFLSTHPEVAAKLLESMPAEQASEVIASAQPDVAGPVLHRMLPTASARCAEQLSADVIADLLEQLPIQAGAAMLRHFSDDARDDAFGRLSAGRAAALRLLLHYPPNTVGAWMETQILTLPYDCDLGEARERVEEDDTLAPTIYVLDRDRKIRGVVNRSALLRESARSSIGVIVSSADPIWARESITQAQGRDVWERDSQAPVVNRHDEFVGVVTHADLKRGLKHLRARPQDDNDDPMQINELYELFVNGLEQTWKGVNEVLRQERSDK